MESFNDDLFSNWTFMFNEDVSFENFENFTFHLNWTFSLSSSDDVIYTFRQILLPFIFVFGLVGNTFAILTFLKKELRKMSCSIYLTVRAISDNIFMISVVCVWLDFIDIRVFHLPGVCQFTVFTSYVCSFLSVWCVVFVTAENYIRICHPHKVSRFCTIRTTKLVICSCLVIAILLNVLPLWLNHVKEEEGIRFCVPKQGRIHRTLGNIHVYMDTILTLLIPLILIFILMCLILRNANAALKRHRRRQNVGHKRRRSSPHNKVAKLLTVVSLSFFFLHAPSHIMRAKAIVENFIDKHHAITDTDRAFQYAFSCLYYINFAINWMIYLVSGAGFRKVFCISFCRRCQNGNTSRNGNAMELASSPFISGRRITETHNSEITRTLTHSRVCSIETLDRTPLPDVVQ